MECIVHYMQSTWHKWKKLMSVLLLHIRGVADIRHYPANAGYPAFLQDIRNRPDSFNYPAGFRIVQNFEIQAFQQKNQMSLAVLVLKIVVFEVHKICVIFKQFLSIFIPFLSILLSIFYRVKKLKIVSQSSNLLLKILNF